MDCCSVTVGASRRVSAGFTLIELLVTIAVIAILVAIVVVAMSRAMGNARRAATGARLSSIGQAIGSFEKELGYEPPLITPESQNWTFGVDPYPATNNSFTVPQSRFYEELGLSGNAARQAMARTRYMSEFSLTVYLMGVGDLYQSNNANDGMSSVYDDGVAGPGIANPGRDRSWGGARNRQNQDARPGPVIGPYLDPGQFADALELVEFGGSMGGGGARGLYRLVDQFDYPIRYYQGLLTTVPANAGGVDPNSSVVGRPTGRYLPPELRSLSSWEAFLADPAGPTINGFEIGAVDNDLTGAKWALLSAGQQGEDVDPDVDPALSAARASRYFIAPFGDSATLGGARQMFQMEPLSSAASQINAFQSQMPLLRRAIESNVRVIGR